MSQVKKDILNGWKEIAAYVARDRRTVERWEKQRGLPVRRMPGEGRATVYALISELDEWLASSKPYETEAAEPEPGGAEGNSGPVPAARTPGGAPTQDRIHDGISAGNLEAIEPAAVFFATNGKGTLGDEVRAEATPAPRAPTITRAPAFPTASRWEMIAAWAILAGLGIIFVLASPDVRRHLGPGQEREKLSTDAGGGSSVLHKHSRIAGVDDLYLAGIYSLEQRTPESLERAEQDFTSAIAKDPNFAPAHAALAETYILLREFYVMPDVEAFTKAKDSAEHAIALDPRLSEAHASLGFIDFFWSWETTEAEREFRTAIADDPTSAHAHHWYGSMLTHEGRYDEALAQLNTAQRLEPTSAAILSTRAFALGLDGHRGEAVDVLEQVINESPGVSSPHAILATLSKMEPPDWGRYLDEIRRAAELRHSDEMLQVAAAAEPALHRGGERAMWAAILETEEKLHPGSANRTFLMIDAEAALGHDDAAFADLEQLTQRHDPNMMGLIVDPTLAPLRRDRRYRQLLGSMGLPAQE